MINCNFEDVFILILLGIIVMLSIKCSKKCSEKFNPDDIYEHQGNAEGKSCKFSLDCCPSKYSTDKGCLCMGKNESKEIMNRGTNHNLKKK